MHRITQAEEQDRRAELYARCARGYCRQRRENLEAGNVKNNMISTPDGIVAKRFGAFCNFEVLSRIHGTTRESVREANAEFTRCYHNRPLFLITHHAPRITF
jgi:hypothetical protein